MKLLFFSFYINPFIKNNKEQIYSNKVFLINDIISEIYFFKQALP